MLWGFSNCPKNYAQPWKRTNSKQWQHLRNTGKGWKQQSYGLYYLENGIHQIHLNDCVTNRKQTIETLKGELIEMKKIYWMHNR